MLYLQVIQGYDSCFNDIIELWRLESNLKASCQMNLQQMTKIKANFRPKVPQRRSTTPAKKRESHRHRAISKPKLNMHQSDSFKQFLQQEKLFLQSFESLRANKAIASPMHDIRLTMEYLVIFCTIKFKLSIVLLRYAMSLMLII